MKYLFALCFSVVISVPSLRAQGGTWVWMNGGPSLTDTSNFGTLGVPSTLVTPNIQYQGLQWTDTAGKFWMYDGFANLFKYDPTVNTWCWVNGNGRISEYGDYGAQGVPSPTNNPGARQYGTPTWTDDNGDLWLFGGLGYDSVTGGGVKNDLWRYNIANNEWTWMKGPYLSQQSGNYGNLKQPSPSNLPPPRAECNTSWELKNELWLFGGQNANGFACFNDIWKYTIAANEWAWMGGGKDTDQPYNYGRLGVETSANRPPARASYTHWIGANNDLYIFGGIDFKRYNFFNDVWRYSTVTNNWTWIAGDSVPNAAGKYRQNCSGATDQAPWARFEQRAAQLTGCNNIFFMFGGWVPVGAEWQSMNDLWYFNPVTNVWKWVSGYSTVNAPGHTGQQGVPSTSNMPDARAGHCLWTDRAGNLWLFGGQAVNFGGNDMWEFIPHSACVPFTAGSDTLQYQLSANSICSGDSISISFQNDCRISISPSNNAVWLDSINADLTPPTSMTYVITGYNQCGEHSDSIFIPVLSDSTIITANKTILCPNDTIQICATNGFSKYHWSTGDTSSCIEATFAGNYFVTITENGNCSAVSNQVTINNSTTSPPQINAKGDTLITSDFGAYQWLLNGAPINGATSSFYIERVAGSYSLQIIDTQGCNLSSNSLTITGLANTPGENRINVSPNPSNGFWQLNVGSELLGSVIEIFACDGHIVLNSIIDKLNPTISLPNITNGIYELRITSSSYTVVKKIVKM